MSAPTARRVAGRQDSSEVDVTHVLAASREAEIRDRVTPPGPVRSDRLRVAAARRALRAYAPYAPTRVRRPGPAR